MKNYMDLALEEAKKSLKTNDVPIGAVIVYKNKVISKAHNTKEKNKIVTHHAEIIAINKACKKLKTWHLNDCELYVTMQPCLMCSGAIIQSRIKKIVYIISNEKFNYVDNLEQILINNKINVEKYKDDNSYKKMIQEFFKEKRK